MPPPNEPSPHDPDEDHLTPFLRHLRETGELNWDLFPAHVYERLRGLARQRLNTFPGLRAEVDTGDVLHNTLMKLIEQLPKGQVNDAAHLLRLTAKMMRNSLLDLARRQGRRPVADGGELNQLAGADPEPHELAQEREWHRVVEHVLDETQRAVIDLLHYQGLTQADAARQLGMHERTVRKHWQNAGQVLRRHLGGAAE